MLEEDRLEPGRFGDVQELVLARGRLEVIEEPRELGFVLEPGFFHHDRQPEVDRQHEHPQRAVVLLHEVVERGHHAVARATFVDRVVVERIQSALRQHVLRSRANALHLVRLAELLGDALGHVIEIAAAVRPADIVHDEHRQGRAAPARGLAQHPELVVHGEPVVITVDERDVDRRERREHGVAHVTVEDVATRELLLVLGRVELGHRVDHVQLGVGSEAFEHQRRRLAPQRADLDDPPRARRLHQRPDHAIPERIHPSGRAFLCAGSPGER